MGELLRFRARHTEHLEHDLSKVVSEIGADVWVEKSQRQGPLVAAGNHQHQEFQILGVEPVRFDGSADVPLEVRAVALRHSEKAGADGDEDLRDVGVGFGEAQNQPDADAGDLRWVRQVGGAAGQISFEPFEQACGYRCEHRLLAVEMVVERPNRDVGAIGDRLDRDFRALLDEQLSSRFHDGVPRAALAALLPSRGGRDRVIGRAHTSRISASNGTINTPLNSESLLFMD